MVCLTIASIAGICVPLKRSGNWKVFFLKAGHVMVHVAYEYVD